MLLSKSRREVVGEANGLTPDAFQARLARELVMQADVLDPVKAILRQRLFEMVAQRASAVASGSAGAAATAASASSSQAGSIKPAVYGAMVEVLRAHHLTMTAAALEAETPSGAHGALGDWLQSVPEADQEAVQEMMKATGAHTLIDATIALCSQEDRRQQLAARWLKTPVTSSSASTAASGSSETAADLQAQLERQSVAHDEAVKALLEAQKGWRESREALSKVETELREAKDKAKADVDSLQAQANETVKERDGTIANVLAQLQKANDEHKAWRDKATAEAQSAQNQVRQLTDSLDQARRTAATDRQSLADQLHAAQQRIDALTKAATASQQQTASSSNSATEIDGLTRQVRTLTEAHSIMLVTETSLKQERASALAEVEALKAQLLAQSRTVSSTQQDLDAALQQIAELEADSNGRQQLEAAQQQLREKQQQYDRLHAGVAKLQSDLAAANAGLQKAESRIIATKEELDRVQAENAKQRDALIGAQRALDEAERERTSSAHRIEQIQQTKAETERQLQASKSEQAGQATQLKQDLGRAQAALQSAATTHAQELEELRAAAVKARTQLERQVQDTQASLQAAEKALQDQRLQLQNAQVAYDGQLRAAQAEHEKQLAAQKATAHDLEIQVRRLEEQFRLLHADVETQQRNNRSQEGEAEAARQREGALGDRYNQLKRQAMALQSELKKTNAAHRDVVRQLEEEKISHRASQRKAEHLLSLLQDTETILQNQIKAMDSDTMRTPSSSARSSRTTTGSALRSTTTSSRGRLSGGGTILSQ